MIPASKLADIRAQFPFLVAQTTSSRPLTYLDSAATTLKPQAVITAVQRYDTEITANLRRGLYRQAEQVTAEYEQVRQQVADLIQAQASEIVFTSSATAGINGVAQSLGALLQPGDEIIVTELEHHANLLPWLALAQRQQLVLKVLPIDSITGDLDATALPQLLTPKTKLFAISLLSNVLGVPTSAPDLIKVIKAYQPKIKVLVDAAQAAAYLPINVQNLNCDFLVFSGHKLFAPTGVGVLYIKQELAAQLPPFQFGGGMLFDLNLAQQQASWLPAPHKFEAGTPPIAQVLGLGAALQFYQEHVRNLPVAGYLASLTAQLLQGLNQLAGAEQLDLRILGDQQQLAQAGHLVSFVSNKYHAHDLAAYLDQFGICVRAGHHCAQPLHQRLGVTSSVRVSFQIYNQVSDVQAVLRALAQLPKLIPLVPGA